ncbi:MAG: 50S ribosomal protein L32 [Eubacteriales bacterium]|nr:50S ribosomal protein L32 [Clostridiales bacterium]MDY5836921.1 50S ribosomal protein L32 [Eubacteriales bacterium]
MAVPKRKWSKRRSRMSRAQEKLSSVNLSECPQCHELKLPHVVCKNCGYYKGREVVAIDKEA